MKRYHAGVLLVNARFPKDDTFTNGSIRTENGAISELGTVRQGDIDCQGMYVLPGFIDTHVHGWDGANVMDGVDGTKRLASLLPQFGVTSFLASTYSDTEERTRAALEGIKRAMQESVGAQILGAHAEGPYLNAGARGAQKEEFIRPASSEEYEKWFELGIVKIITLAPEIPENSVCIGTCRAHNCVVAIGHSLATYDEAMTSFQAGVTRATHTGNGMRPFHHRDPGVVGAAISDERIVCEIIADLVHLHPATIKMIIAAKGVDMTVLVTDAVARATRSGEIIRTPDGALAGSSLTMDLALRNTMHATGKSLEELWPVTSRTAARQLGVQKGSIEVGYDADFVVLDGNSNVTMTIVGGKVVFKR